MILYQLCDYDAKIRTIFELPNFFDSFFEFFEKKFQKILYSIDNQYIIQVFKFYSTVTKLQTHVVTSLCYSDK